MEVRKYKLDVDRNGEVFDFTLTPRIVACMKATQRIQLPPAFIHNIRTVNRFETELVCEAFTISNQYPNNIVVLSGDRVMYCVSFSQESVENDDLASRFYLKGFIFQKVTPQWWDPCPSSRIGNYFAEALDVTALVSVSAMDLVSKAFISARGPDEMKRPFPQTDPLPARLHPILRQFQSTDDLGERKVLMQSLRVVSKDCRAKDPGYALDYWWVNSMFVPGRFPNHGQ